jgi:YidC/Oxa1 family membrane protein insertase
VFHQLFVEPLIQLLSWLTTQLHALPLPSWLSAYGVALVFIAILVKVVTFPLTATQMRSMRRMQELQPELKRLQKVHKDDRETLARAQMDLYKEAGVNPLGGCLPLLIQLPVLWGLFQAINAMGTNPSFHRYVTEQFLWLTDLSQPEPTPTSDPRGLPFLLILMVASQFLYQRFMTPPTTSDGDAQAEAMRSVMKFSPLIFGFLFLKFPAGVVLYYLAFNLASVVQQWFLNRESGIQGVAVAVPAGGQPEPAPNTSVAADAEEASKNEPAKRRRRKQVR